MISRPKIGLLSVFILFFVIITIFVFPKNNSLKKSDHENNPSLFPSATTQTLGKKSEDKLDLNNEGVKVVRAIDGDTIEIEGGQKVRYIGIDTPETSDPRKPIQCFGKESADKNRELVEGKKVYLEKDISETDKYGRLLRYVYIDNIFINDYLVRQGFAYSSSYPPDIKYQDQFVNAQDEAMRGSSGLWDICSGSVDKSASSQPQAVSGPNGCQIKGNISTSSEKIYHMPGQKYYDKTQINESKGERWFCTEEEAVAAGWRKSKI